MQFHPPADIHVIERDWLSSNQIVLLGDEGNAVIDTGYWAHSPQTVSLMQHALKNKPLDFIFNTHLHSDHCGGNRALQTNFPNCKTHIPPGLSDLVKDWRYDQFNYQSTGQFCPEFKFDSLLVPGQSIQLNYRTWQIHAAPGHDPDSIVLFEPDLQILISADSLWENGFGVVFPELDQISAFNEVKQTLDLLSTLKPRYVIPGHGNPFANFSQALDRAYTRLEQFVTDPQKHALYTAKVLIKFKLLELQQISVLAFNAWLYRNQLLLQIHTCFFPTLDYSDWFKDILNSLASNNALSIENGFIKNL